MSVKKMLQTGAGAVLLGAAAGASTVAPAATEPADAPTAIRPALVGSKLPDLTLRDAQGAVFDLGAAVGKRRTILILYRGGW